PEGVLKQHWVWGPNVPECLIYQQVKCEVFVGDLDGDGKDELVFASYIYGGRMGPGQVLAQNPDGTWKPVGALNEPPCVSVLDAMRAGNFGRAAPSSRWHNVMAGNAELRFTPTEPQAVTCPAK